MVVWLQLSYRRALPLEYRLVQCKAWPSTRITNQKLNYVMYWLVPKREWQGETGDAMGLGM